jgi:hypothetical protein
MEGLRPSIETSSFSEEGLKLMRSGISDIARGSGQTLTTSELDEKMKGVERKITEIFRCAPALPPTIHQVLPPGPRNSDEISPEILLSSIQRPSPDSDIADMVERIAKVTPNIIHWLLQENYREELIIKALEKTPSIEVNTLQWAIRGRFTQSVPSYKVGSGARIYSDLMIESLIDKTPTISTYEFMQLLQIGAPISIIRKSLEKWTYEEFNYHALNFLFRFNDLTLIQMYLNKIPNIGELRPDDRALVFMCALKKFELDASIETSPFSSHTIDIISEPQTAPVMLELCRLLSPDIRIGIKILKALQQANYPQPVIEAARLQLGIAPDWNKGCVIM